jgi:hypothetical protein
MLYREELSSSLSSQFHDHEDGGRTSIKWQILLQYTFVSSITDYLDYNVFAATLVR